MTKFSRPCLKSQKRHVTAALRSSQRIADVLELCPSQFVIIHDLALPGACDSTLASDGFEYIIHTAGEFRFNGSDIKNDIVEPSIDASVLLHPCHHL